MQYAARYNYIVQRANTKSTEIWHTFMSTHIALMTVTTKHMCISIFTPMKTKIT